MYLRPFTNVRYCMLISSETRKANLYEKNVLYNHVVKLLLLRVRRLTNRYISKGYRDAI